MTQIEKMFEASPSLRARVAGAFYLMTIVAGSLALVSADGSTVANHLATLCYLAVTLLFYDLFRPVSGPLSLLAALFGVVGCTAGTLRLIHLDLIPINSLAFFGVQCLLIGALIFRSTFLPRALGVLMAFGGLGWLTFAWPPLARLLSPYNMFPGILGETALTVWLLAKGVNDERWRERASAAGHI